MNPFGDNSTFDRLRAHADGTMPNAERVRFEAEIARDPELARLAAELRAVWVATAPGLGVAAASRSTFDDVVARGRPGEFGAIRAPAWRRRAAVAAILLVLVPVAWAAWRFVQRHQAAVVELRALPLSAGSERAESDVSVPAVLASWSPVENGEIRWLESLDLAREVSAAVRRPIFVYGYVESCPICRGFQAREFQDPEVLALVDQAIPVRIDLLALDENEMKTLWERRYPLLEIQDERGGIVRTFPGQFAEVDMAAELSRAVAGLAGPNWRLVRDLTVLFQNARMAEADGRFAEAARSFEELEAERELPQFAAAGEAGLWRVALVARRLVENARGAAANDADRARADFEQELTRFSGTPFESDLRAIAAAWRERGRFPELRVQR